jgi:hypothetical protein
LLNSGASRAALLSGSRPEVPVKTNREEATEELGWALDVVIVIAVMAAIWAFAGAARGEVPDPERAVIVQACERNHCTGELQAIVLAIRKAENGRAGRELGVLHPRAINTNLDTQAGWAAATVVKNHRRWEAAGRPGDFIDYLAARYAPANAENDPKRFNTHWAANVRYWYGRMR